MVDRLPARDLADASDRFLSRAWTRAFNPDRDIDWAAIDPSLLPEEHRSAVRFVTVIEDHLPGYFAVYSDKLAVDDTVEPDEFLHNREFYRFAVKWAQEEDWHADVLFKYQVAAGIASADELREALAVEGRKRFDVPYDDPLPIFTYTFLQEKATQLFYHQFAQVVREPVLRQVLRRLTQDEGRHFVYFADLLERYLRRYGAAAVPEMQAVVTTFRMPLAETIRSYWRWALRVADTAGYDHTAAFEDLVRLIDRVADAPTRAAASELTAFVHAVRGLAPAGTPT